MTSLHLPTPRPVEVMPPCALVDPRSWVDRYELQPSASVSVSVGSVATMGGDPLLLPIDPALIIADWISDRGVAGTGSSVSSWTDQVNGNVVSQASGPAQPTLVSGAAPSGRAAIRFNGLAHFLAQAAFDLSALQDVDMWSVLVRTPNGNAQNLIDRGGPVRLLYNSIATIDNVQAFLQGNVGSDLERESDATVADTMRLYRYRFHVSEPAGSEARGFFDSSLTQFDMRIIDNDNTSPNFGSGPLRVGARLASAGGANFAAFDLARLAFIQKTADQVAIAQFLADTYGVP